jgi:protease secretion system membrane fusion protein
MKLISNKAEKPDTKVVEGLATAVAHPPIDVDMDESRPLRWGMWTLAFGFGGFLLWAGLAPLDAGVNAPGTVVVASRTKTIQHQFGGTVERILVDEGAKVKKGQLLIQLNSTDARSQLNIVKAQFISAKAMEGRLLAERAGAAKVTYDPSLDAFGDDPNVKAAEALQNQLFTTRRANLKSEIGMLQEQVAGLSEQLKGFQSLLASRQSQSKWMKDELSGIRDLAKDGYVPKNRMFQLERSAADIDGSLADTVARIGQARNSISETKLRILSTQQQYQKEVETQLAEDMKEAQAAFDRVKALTYQVNSMDIRSPIDGVVNGLAIHTVGGVIQPGFHIMDIVPENEPLIVEARVSTDKVNKIAVGKEVDINFPALDRRTTPSIPGTVMTISADSQVEQRTGVAFYLAQVKVTKEGMKLIGKQQIMAGMPAALVIKTGERSLLSYLIKPLYDSVKSAFTED